MYSHKTQPSTDWSEISWCLLGRLDFVTSLNECWALFCNGNVFHQKAISSMNNELLITMLGLLQRVIHWKAAPTLRLRFLSVPSRESVFSWERCSLSETFWDCDERSRSCRSSVLSLPAGLVQVLKFTSQTKRGVKWQFTFSEKKGEKYII